MKITTIVVISALLTCGLFFFPAPVSAYPQTNEPVNVSGEPAADAEDFPTLARTGLHSETELKQTRMITGRSTAEITMMGRPGRSSGAGFMGENEDIISVLINDNRLVKKLGLTHPQMAKPLLYVWNLIQQHEEMNREKHRQRKNLDHFMYNGKKIYLKSRSGHGWQESIFNDGIRGMYHIEVRRHLEPEEKAFLDKKFPDLDPQQKANLVKRLSYIHTGEMVASYIMRYGFYEGKTGYRADPVAITFIFGLKSIDRIEEAFKGDWAEWISSGFEEPPDSTVGSPAQNPSRVNAKPANNNSTPNIRSYKNPKLNDLVRRITDVNDRNNDVILKAAAEIGEPAVEPLVSIIRDRAWNNVFRGYWTQTRAVWALASIKSENVVNFFISVLKDKRLTSHLRTNIVRTLGGLKLEKSVEPLLDVLNDRQVEPRVRGAAAFALKFAKRDNVIESLILALNDEDSHVRGGAVISLGKMGTQRSNLALLKALKDEGAMIRWRVIVYLRELKDKTLAHHFVRALADKDWMVREIAKKALVDIGEPVLETLARTLKSPHAHIRWEVVCILGRIKSQKSIGVLVEALKDNDWMVRNEAAVALTRIKSERSRQPLTRLLTHKNRSIQEEAAWVLKNLK
jgi:HEAT repeat protein